MPRPKMLSRGDMCKTDSSTAALAPGLTASVSQPWVYGTHTLVTGVGVGGWHSRSVQTSVLLVRVPHISSDGEA